MSRYIFYYSKVFQYTRSFVFVSCLSDDRKLRMIQCAVDLAAIRSRTFILSTHLVETGHYSFLQLHRNISWYCRDRKDNVTYQGKTEEGRKFHMHPNFGSPNMRSGFHSSWPGEWILYCDVKSPPTYADENTHFLLLKSSLYF